MSEANWWSGGLAFAPPLSDDLQREWVSLPLVKAFERLFTFDWLDESAGLLGQAPADIVFSCETITKNNASIHDFALLDPDEAHPPLRRQLPPADADELTALLRAAERALWVRVEGERKSAAAIDVHTLELLNPLSHSREVLTVTDFCALVEKLENVARAARWAESKRLRHASSSRRELPELKASGKHLAGSMLLANIFAAKRMPFADITRMTAALGYQATHTCLREVDEPAVIGWRRLIALYG